MAKLTTLLGLWRQDADFLIIFFRSTLQKAPPPRTIPYWRSWPTPYRHGLSGKNDRI